MATIDNETLRSNIENTVRSCLMGYKDGAEAKDPSLISRALAANCTRRIIPDSFIKALGQITPLDFTNDKYQEAFASDLTVSAVTRTDIHNLTIDVSAGNAAARTDNVIRFIDGESVRLEFCWFFDLNEDGTEITNIIEFADSKDATTFQTKVYALIDEKKRGGS